MRKYKRQLAITIAIFLAVLNLLHTPHTAFAQQKGDTEIIPDNDVIDLHEQPVKEKKETPKKKGFFSKYKWWILGGVLLLGGGAAAAAGPGAREAARRDHVRRRDCGGKSLDLDRCS